MENKSLRFQSDLTIQREGSPEVIEVKSSENGQALIVDFANSTSLLEVVRSVRSFSALKQRPRQRLEMVNQAALDQDIYVDLTLAGKTLLRLGRDKKPLFDHRFKFVWLTILYMLGRGRFKTAKAPSRDESSNR